MSCSVADQVGSFGNSLDPDLFFLADWGGGIPTHFPMAGSPLIDEGFRTEVPFLVAELPTIYLIDGSFCMRYKARSVADLSHPDFQEALDAALKGAAIPEVRCPPWIDQVLELESGSRKRAGQ